MTSQIKNQLPLAFMILMLWGSSSHAMLLYKAPSGLEELDGHTLCHQDPPKLSKGSPQKRSFNLYRDWKKGLVVFIPGYQFSSESRQWDMSFFQKRITPSGEEYRAFHKIRLDGDGRSGSWETFILESGKKYKSKFSCSSDDRKEISSFDRPAQVKLRIIDNFPSAPCTKNPNQCSETDL